MILKCKLVLKIWFKQHCLNEQTKCLWQKQKTKFACYKSNIIYIIFIYNINTRNQTHIPFSNVFQNCNSQFSYSFIFTIGTVDKTFQSFIQHHKLKTPISLTIITIDIYTDYGTSKLQFLISIFTTCTKFINNW